MSTSSSIDRLLADLDPAAASPVYLVQGERVLAEPAALRIAEALAAPSAARPEVHRRPPRLAPFLADLQTYSLFGGGKILVIVETALFSDLSAAADLVDEAAEALPISEAALAGEPGHAERRAARRLVRVLRLFDVDPSSGDAAAAISSLPDWVLKGGAAAGAKGRRGRTKKQIEDLVAGLAVLLELARGDDVEGWAESELAVLGGILEDGLPEGHALVLVERAVDERHPLVRALEKRAAAVRVGQVESGQRGGWQGLDLLAEELERETATAIDRHALAELARRTLRQDDARGGGRGSARVQADSTERFAGEYRKLADLAAGGRISSKLVEENVEDRGEEDVWKILDAVGEGKASDALHRIDRLLAAADDQLSARLQLFGLLAGFCGHLAAVGGMIRAAGVPRGERSYNRFKTQHAPALQRELEGGLPNPLAGLHPFRLFRAYQAASNIPQAVLTSLPYRVLETELRLKGESAAVDTALAEFVTEVARACSGR